MYVHAYYSYCLLRGEVVVLEVWHLMLRIDFRERGNDLLTVDKWKVCVCVHIYIYTHIHTYIYVYKLYREVHEETKEWSRLSGQELAINSVERAIYCGDYRTLSPSTYKWEKGLTHFQSVYFHSFSSTETFKYYYVPHGVKVGLLSYHHQF